MEAPLSETLDCGLFADSVVGLAQAHLPDGLYKKALASGVNPNSLHSLPLAQP